jgi:hypothetical protein
MRKFSISVAMITTFAAFGAPALADHNGGGPNQKAGQCFIYSSGTSKDGTFGYWGACPQPASVAAAPKRTRGNASR